MQRELFGLVDWFVVLNETGRRMLVSNGSSAAKIVLNRLGLSHAAAHTEARARGSPDAERPYASATSGGFTRPRVWWSSRMRCPRSRLRSRFISTSAGR